MPRTAYTVQIPHWVISATPFCLPRPYNSTFARTKSVPLFRSASPETTPTAPPFLHPCPAFCDSLRWKTKPNFTFLAFTSLPKGPKPHVLHIPTPPNLSPLPLLHSSPPSRKCRVYLRKSFPYSSSDPYSAGDFCGKLPVDCAAERLGKVFLLKLKAVSGGEQRNISLPSFWAGFFWSGCIFPWSRPCRLMVIAFSPPPPSFSFCSVIVTSSRYCKLYVTAHVECSIITVCIYVYIFLQMFRQN